MARNLGVRNQNLSKRSEWTAYVAMIAGCAILIGLYVGGFIW